MSYYYIMACTEIMKNYVFWQLFIPSFTPLRSILYKEKFPMKPFRETINQTICWLLQSSLKLFKISSSSLNFCCVADRPAFDPFAIILSDPSDPPMDFGSYGSHRSHPLQFSILKKCLTAIFDFRTLTENSKKNICVTRIFRFFDH